MSTFEDHLEACRNEDGSYDLAAAEKSRAEELAETPGEIDRLAAKAAKAERNAWESRNREALKKQFLQPALSPELDLVTKVPMGGSSVENLGAMNEKLIRLRMDLRTETHIGENRAFDTEIEFWLNTLKLLPPGGTIGGLDS
jgi:hypothetical protein